MRQPDREAGRREDPGMAMSPLGPPGWAEFSAARERFMRTVAVSGLEAAWSAPAREPRELGREEGPP